MGRGVSFGQAVDIMDVGSRHLLEALGDRRSDRSAATVDLAQGRQVAGLDVRVLHHGQEGGDAGHGKGALPALDQAQSLRAIKAVEEDEGQAGQHCDALMGDQPGDVKQRRGAQNHVALSKLHPHPVHLRVEDDVAVGVQRPLGTPGGPRGVGEDGDVLRLQPRVRDRATVELRDERDKVLCIWDLPPLHRGEERARRGSAQVVELGRGDDRAHVGALDSLAPGPLIQRLQSDQRAGTRVGQMVVDLLRLEHRIERDHAAAELPGRQQTDEELGHILEVQRHAVAP